jgi:hypothetical protein
MGIQDDIKEIKANIIPEKKEKFFGLPFKAKVRNKKAKNGWVGILKINENGFITGSKQQITEQTVMVDGVPRLATPDYILKLKKGFNTYPVLILPSWSVEPLKPFSPKENYEESLAKGSNIAGYRLLLNRMKLSTVEGGVKKSLGWMAWLIVLGLVGVIIYAIFFTRGSNGIQKT